MPKSSEFVYEPRDVVKIEGKDGLWTVIGSFGVAGQPPSRYDLMLERDNGKLAMGTPDKMKLVERAKRQDDLGGRLIPARGIMDF